MTEYNKTGKLVVSLGLHFNFNVGMRFIEKVSLSFFDQFTNGEKKNIY
jgi:hypothetical protein